MGGSLANTEHSLSGTLPLLISDNRIALPPTPTKNTGQALETLSRRSSGRRRIIDVQHVFIISKLSILFTRLPYAEIFPGDIFMKYPHRVEPHDSQPLDALNCTIRISPQRIAQGLALIIFALVFASALGLWSKYFLNRDVVFGLIRLFDLAGEGNVPTWYSSFTLLLCALLLAIIGHAKKGHHDLYARHWQVLALIFFYISLDEGARIHELTIKPLREAFHLSGMFYYAWVLPGGVVLLILSFFYFQFVLTLPAKTRRLFIVAGSVYVSAGIGVEMIEGVWISLAGTADLTFKVLTNIEEAGEMIGTALFLYALLVYIREQRTEVRLQIQPITEDRR